MSDYFQLIIEIFNRYQTGHSDGWSKFCSFLLVYEKEHIKLPVSTYGGVYNGGRFRHLKLLGTDDGEWKMKFPVSVFFQDARKIFKLDALGLEILQIALPTALAFAADPVASLIDTAFIGRLGPVPLAAVGVLIAIFNQASKVTIFPLVSITTSFVAEEDTFARMKSEVSVGDELQELLSENTQNSLEEGSSFNDETKKLLPEAESITIATNAPNHLDNIKVQNEKRHAPSASTALLLACILGFIQAILLIFLAKPILRYMGVNSDSSMLIPAQRYLTLRSLGAPAVLLSLAMQGIFRGLKDTKTPLYATVAGDVMNIILDPILIFSFHLGVSGAAVAHVLSQYLISLILLCKLVEKVHLIPPSAKDLQFGRFLKNGTLLLARVTAVTFCVTLAASMAFCVTLAASMATRLGTRPMAAFQICLQVWMTSSLLADGLAVAGQAILASAFAEKDYKKATAAATRVLQMGFVLGLGLSVVVGLGLHFGSVVFTEDKAVLYLIRIGIPFVAATQPINCLAFVFDGVNFGASDFVYSAISMVLVAIVSIASLFILSKCGGFIGIWLALAIYMGLRAFAGVWRMGTGTGPWCFLRHQPQK